MPGIKGTMGEYAEGKLHSGSKEGPVVKSRAQAIAIGLSEERKEGHKVAPKPSGGDHEPAVLKHDPGPSGHPGQRAGMESKSHGFGHAAHKRSGHLRNSGHPGAHRIGKR